MTATVAIAMLLDAVLGEPKWLWSRFPHPAVLMGRLVGTCDARFNQGSAKRIKGAAVMTALVIGAALLGWIIDAIPDFGIIPILIGAILIAQKSLCEHVSAVADALRISTEQGRVSVAMIVGRDTTDMTPSDVSRSAIESAAENLSDGVIAPVFWFLIAGLPGLLVYKITNTADSMIGYRTPRHEKFGWAAARFDDVLNWVPARLTALLIALCHNTLSSLDIIRRDAPLHRSPNAGYPETAMAVAIDVSLAGPRSYDGKKQDFPFVHPEGAATLTPAHIDAAVRALWRTWGGAFIIVTIIALLFQGPRP